MFNIKKLKETKQIIVSRCYYADDLPYIMDVNSLSDLQKNYKYALDYQMFWFTIHV